MSKLRTWPVAVLAIAIVIFFWGGEDEDQHEAEQSTQQEKPVIPASSNWQPEPQQTPALDAYGRYEPSADIYGNYSSGYGRTGEYGSSQFSGLDGFRFRTPSGATSRDNYNEPSYPQYQGSEYPAVTDEMAFQSPPGYGALQQPRSKYSFRPLEKKPKAKRWTGNYGQRSINPSTQPSMQYPYNEYPAPAYPHQSMPEPDPMWANSWPDR